ncbi:MAG TPA: MFS transporter [Nitrososphaera sp.]|nr:MFS transporter [Nitrososphaera sp.]
MDSKDDNNPNPDSSAPPTTTAPGGMRNVTALGLVSFFTDFSTEMVLGVLPFFIVSTLGASRALLGAIEGSAELAGYAFRMLSGSWSDKMGKRKVFVVAGYAVSTASKPFMAAATEWIDALLIRTSDRIGKGIRTAPRDALIADSVPASRSGRAFGIHRTIDQLGAIVGPMAAFALLQVVDIRGVFLASLIPGVIALLILILFVKEVFLKKEQARTTVLGNIGSLLKGNKPLVFLFIITGIFSLGAYNFSFVLIRASDLGVGESLIPLVYAAINVSHAAIGIPSGILADRIGKEKVLIVGYAVFLVSTLLMVTLAGNTLYSYAIAAVFGLYAGISETVQRAVIPRYVSSELRGTAFGLYYLIIGVCFFASNVFFGYLWDSYSLAAAVTYSTIITMIAISGMATFIKKYATINGSVAK